MSFGFNNFFFYQVFETGTSDRCLIGIVQLLRFSGFSLYSLSFFFYSPFKIPFSGRRQGLMLPFRFTSHPFNWTPLSHLNSIITPLINTAVPSLQILSINSWQAINLLEKTKLFILWKKKLLSQGRHRCLYYYDYY